MENQPIPALTAVRIRARHQFPTYAAVLGTVLQELSVLESCLVSCPATSSPSSASTDVNPVECSVGTAPQPSSLLWRRSEHVICTTPSQHALRVVVHRTGSVRSAQDQSKVVVAKLRDTCTAALHSSLIWTVLASIATLSAGVRLTAELWQISSADQNASPSLRQRITSLYARWRDGHLLQSTPARGASGRAFEAEPAAFPNYPTVHPVDRAGSTHKRLWRWHISVMVSGLSLAAPPPGDGSGRELQCVREVIYRHAILQLLVPSLTEADGQLWWCHVVWYRDYKEQATCAVDDSLYTSGASPWSCSAGTSNPQATAETGVTAGWITPNTLASWEECAVRLLTLRYPSFFEPESQAAAAGEGRNAPAGTARVRRGWSGGGSPHGADVVTVCLVESMLDVPMGCRRGERRYGQGMWGQRDDAVAARLSVEPLLVSRLQRAEDGWQTYGVVDPTHLCYSALTRHSSGTVPMLVLVPRRFLSAAALPTSSDVQRPLPADFAALYSEAVRAARGPPDSGAQQHGVTRGPARVPFMAGGVGREGKEETQSRDVLDDTAGERRSGGATRDAVTCDFSPLPGASCPLAHPLATTSQPTLAALSACAALERRPGWTLPSLAPSATVHISIRTLYKKHRRTPGPRRTAVPYGPRRAKEAFKSSGSTHADTTTTRRLLQAAVVELGSEADADTPVASAGARGSLHNAYAAGARRSIPYAFQAPQRWVPAPPTSAAAAARSPEGIGPAGMITGGVDGPWTALQWDRKFIVVLPHRPPHAGTDRTPPWETPRKVSEDLRGWAVPQRVAHSGGGPPARPPWVILDQHAVHERLRLEYFCAYVEAFVRHPELEDIGRAGEAISATNDGDDQLESGRLQDRIRVSRALRAELCGDVDAPSTTPHLRQTHSAAALFTVPADLVPLVTQHAASLHTWGWRWRYRRRGPGNAGNVRGTSHTPCVEVHHGAELSLEGFTLTLNLPLHLRRMLGELEAVASRAPAAAPSSPFVIIPSDILRFLVTRSCRGALMFGDSLNNPRHIRQLVHDLGLPQQYYLCAHGRCSFAHLPAAGRPPPTPMVPAHVGGSPASPHRRPFSSTSPHRPLL